MRRNKNTKKSGQIRNQWFHHWKTNHLQTFNETK